MYNWATFLIGSVNAQIFSIINKTRVKDLYIARDLLRRDNFFGGDDFENIFFK